MKTCIALLRGINVGGKNALPMKAFREMLEDLGCRDVETYIQSGNAVFRTNERSLSSLSNRIGSRIEEAHGFRPHILLLSAGDFERAIEENPFPEGEANHKSLHFFFLDSPPKKPDLERLNEMKADTERFELKKRVFYLHAPEGIGYSKLAMGVEKALGVPTTARNWRTVSKILEMTREID